MTDVNVIIKTRGPQRSFLLLFLITHVVSYWAVIPSWDLMGDVVGEIKQKVNH